MKHSSDVHINEFDEVQKKITPACTGEDVAFLTKLSTLHNLSMLLGVPLFKELFLYVLYYLGLYGHPSGDRNKKGHKRIVTGKHDFFHRQIFWKILDGFHRPLVGKPGRMITIKDRELVGWSKKHTERYGIYSPFETGKTTTCLNMGSYNYMGFAENADYCSIPVKQSLQYYGAGASGCALELGHYDVHVEAEKAVASFLGQEAALVFGMGFASNSSTIPAIVGPGDLIVSDSKNHASICIGCRGSGAKVKPFKHNDMTALEKTIRRWIARGQPGCSEYTPWGKILIVVEGIYSMEGDILNLPSILALKKKYKCYLYVDEAHSIGALGPHGRGVCDYFGVNPRDVDILMGTFSKSFGSVGGYISGNRQLVEYIRQRHWSALYANNISIPIAVQVIKAIDVITGRDGTDNGQRKLQQIKNNTKLFRSMMQKMGFSVMGVDDSPVVPVLGCQMGRLFVLTREAYKLNLALVIVGTPATSVYTSRVRFCMSASHTTQDIIASLKVMDTLGDLCKLKYHKRAMEKKWGNVMQQFS